MTEIVENTGSIVDGRYKDRSPSATIQRIKDILAENGLQTEETWFESGVPYCYSNKIKIPGTTFRTIGKGLTKEFAIASGYGEMIERLQVGFIYGPTSLKDGDFAIDDAKYEMISASELLAKNRRWYEQMADVLLDSTGEKITPEQLLKQCSTQDGMVSVTPYMDLSTLEKAYFPTVLRKRIYGSNGCAAGNTPEEALVQAISELVERNHMIRVVKEGLGLPEMPDEELQKYTVSYEIVDFIRNNGYKVIIKDASLGTGFPVFCACIIDRRTGRYHSHFGAHPVLEIALERSLTEIFQGRNVAKISTNEDLTPRSAAKFSLTAFYTELRSNTGNKRPSFFVDESIYSFDPNMGVHTCDNKKILRYCMEYFEKAGHTLLVRDCSCLGFPTYQVIAPGYSECYINRISSKTDDQRYAAHAISALRDPSKASIPDMLGTLMHLDRLKVLDSKLKNVHSFCMLVKLPSSVPFAIQNSLLFASIGYIQYTLGRYQEAGQLVGRMIPLAEEKDLDHLICLKRYLFMLADGYTQDYIEKVLTFFHEKSTTDWLYGILHRNGNPLDEFVLHCDKKCDESCKLHGRCFLKQVDALADMLDEKMAQIDFDDMANYLRSIL